MKTLLLIPSYAKRGLEAEVAAGLHPTMDYDALERELASRPGDQAELLDFAAVEADRNPLTRLLLRTAGRSVALAFMGFVRARRFDAIFTNSEDVALPLALMLRGLRQRPGHVTIAHRPSAEKKRPLYRTLGLHREMDAIFVYASTQRDYARSVLGIPEHVVRLIPFHADHRFYSPRDEPAVRESQICAAGLEWRDYPTLIEAVADQPELSVRLAAASPWSKHRNETESRALPSNVDARRYSYRELRDLYAESAAVVVPLYENDFQAGITTILEAMAMGKPVVVTRTHGQTDVIEHDENGLYVAPGDVAGWRDAITRLRNDASLRERLGRNARAWVEQSATLDRWAACLAGALREAAAAQGKVAHDRGASMTRAGSVSPPHR